jgi:hypothetical protein
VTSGVAGLVLLGFAAVVLLALGVGLDTGSFVIAGFIFAFGALAIAVTRKARAGGIAPGRCAACEGLISPNAPYCKHCGAPT